MLIPTTTTTWGIFLAGCSPLSSMPNNGVKTEVSQFERRCLEPLLLFLSVYFQICSDCIIGALLK